MLHGLYWLAANFASRTPTLLVVDDLHWADEPSLRWLHYLARRLEGLPLLLLTGTRPPEQANLPALVGELLTDPVAVVIRPAVLGRESAAALARERLGNEPAPAFAAALETGSGGNPLYLVALLDAVLQQGLAPTVENAPHVLELGPRAVSYGVSTRLGRLPAEATDLLRAAAILGDRTDLALAAALAGTDSATALTAASALVRADLLRNENPLEFTHPVVRTAVLETLSAAARAHAHRAAAEAILDAGGRPEQAATHLVLTVPSRDDFIVTTLRQAAAHALAQGAAPAAAAYLRRALAEPPPREERPRVLYELGVAELQSGAAESARHLRQAIDELEDATSSPEIVLAYSQATEVAGADLAVDARSPATNERPDARGRRRPALAHRGPDDHRRSVRPRALPADRRTGLNPARRLGARRQWSGRAAGRLGIRGDPAWSFAGACGGLREACPAEHASLSERPLPRGQLSLRPHVRRRGRRRRARLRGRDRACADARRRAVARDLVPVQGAAARGDGRSACRRRGSSADRADGVPGRRCSPAVLGRVPGRGPPRAR